ncbi:MAG: DUF2971 domain-containing protein [Ginsengibacter sp.]
MFSTILYKYRNWNDCYHKRILEQNKLWLSSPVGLNDPYDCQIPAIIDNQEINSYEFFHFLQESFMAEFPGKSLNDNDINEKWNEIKKNPQHFFSQRQSQLLEMYLSFGVFSLCKNPDNFLLWSHYADAHKGLCIGFNIKDLVTHFNGTFEKVTYQRDLPVFKFLENQEETFSKTLATKHIQWDYEKEWRITKINSADQEIDIPDTTIAEVYLGAKMDAYTKEKIMKILSKKTSPIKIFKMQLSKTLFKVEPVLIN